MFQLTPRVWEHLQCEVFMYTLYELELSIAQTNLSDSMCTRPSVRSENKSSVDIAVHTHQPLQTEKPSWTETYKRRQNSVLS